MKAPSVDWRWFLVRTSDLSLIYEMRAHDKSIQRQLNDPGVATWWLDLRDKVAESVLEHQTALLAYRNGVPRWSGPIWKTVEDVSGKNAKLTCTAMGWFENLNHRLLHTGAEFTTMKAASPLPYTGIGTESATQLAYASKSMGSISMDLLQRANVDDPTLIIPGFAQATANVNLTLQQFQNVGEQITRLINTENGFDVDVHPLTRELNIYYQPIIGGVVGKGQDRGDGVLFTFPGNLLGYQNSGDGTKTSNRSLITGQYAVARADDVESQDSNGLLESTSSLSDVVDTNILIAYANAEVEVKRNPWKVLTFTPRSVGDKNMPVSGVPRPYDDYDIGDIAYAKINYGRTKIGLLEPQPVRIYGMTISIDDKGVERVSGIQTSYS